MGSNSNAAGRVGQRIKGDEGASLVEYALLVALISVVCITALVYFQRETSASLSRSASSIEG